MKTAALTLGLLILAPIALGQSPGKTNLPDVSDPGTQPIEVGKVHWSRDLDLAIAQSESSGKPVFVLFQEVPGCDGCRKFGQEVLSDPLLVEAIEDLFIPVLVFNNHQGQDAELLKKYEEPAWNYQVIRFLDGKGNDIIERKDRVWNLNGIAARMIATLKTANRPVPKYLTTMAPIANQSKPATAAFSMFCFWTGEYQLGKIDGVVATEAGFLDGREVTLVHYDQNKISLDALAREAAKVKCAEKVYTAEGVSLAGLPGGKLDRSYRVAPKSDQKRQLMRWKAIHKVPGLKPMQWTKINALAPSDFPQAVSWLSPRQREALKRANNQK